MSISVGNNTASDSACSKESDSATWMNEARRDMLAHLGKVADHVIPNLIASVARQTSGYRDNNVCYPLAWLYATAFEGNRRYRSEAALNAAITAAEKRLCYQTARGGYDSDDEVQQGDEWQAYFLIRAAEVLGRDGLGSARWERWADSVARYADCHGSRAFFYSAPNHDAWKCMTLYLAGDVFEQPDWQAWANFQMTQLLRYQTEPGFWDENRHHGPSTSYNHTMSTPLFLYWKASGRADVRAALERLLDFMMRYGHPDGAPGGALDGRMHARSGRLNAAMTLTPEGRRWNRLAWENWERASIVGDRPPGGDAAMLAAWHTDFLRFADHGTEADTAAPERDGHLATDRSGDFKALARRQGPWHLALSGVFSDIPKESDNEFRTTRQNRIDLWHERVGPMIGGGSLHRSVERQLANLFIDTDYFAEADFGRILGNRPETVRAVYFPRFTDTDADEDRSYLDLTFAHAQARFALRPVSENEFEIGFAMQSVKVRRAFLCLPLIVWPGSEIRVDGRPLGASPPDQTAVSHTVSITGSRRGTPWEARVPQGVAARLNAPFSPIFAHKPDVRKKKEDEGYEVTLLAMEAATSGPALPGPIRIAVLGA